MARKDPSPQSHCIDLWKKLVGYLCICAEKYTFMQVLEYRNLERAEKVSESRTELPRLSQWRDVQGD
jgi:hypothetical protein